jgi:hypothetical protein
MAVMKDEIVFMPNNVSVSNLKNIDSEQKNGFELKVYELSELAFSAADFFTELLSRGLGIYEILALISDGVAFPFTETERRTIAENEKKLTSFSSGIGSIDKAIFSDLLFGEMKRRGKPYGESDFLHTSDVPETFVYVRNMLADEAYDVFSQEFSDPRVRYVGSFKEACIEVESGNVGYCILPLEEKGGNRLSGISDMLFAYDLKIASVTPVFGPDGVADVKYALVCSSYSVPDIEFDDDRYLEIRISTDNELSAAELLLAAESFGITVYRINSATFRTEDGDKPFYTVVFKGTGVDFSPLLTFLTLFGASFTPIGIYKNLE